MSCVGCNADIGQASPTCAQNNGLLTPDKSQCQGLEADVRKAVRHECELIELTVDPWQI